MSHTRRRVEHEILCLFIRLFIHSLVLKLIVVACVGLPSTGKHESQHKSEIEAGWRPIGAQAEARCLN